MTNRDITIFNTTDKIKFVLLLLLIINKTRTYEMVCLENLNKEPNYS